MKTMMKRTLAVCLALLLLCGLVPTAFAAASVVASGKTNTGVQWTLTNDGTLSFSGNGELEDNSEEGDYEYSAWDNYGSQIKKLVIGSGITAVRSWAFGGCEYLEEISLPSTLKTIYEDTFGNGENLKSFSVAADSKYFSVDQGVALYDTANAALLRLAPQSGLKSYSVKNGTKRIADGAFRFCSALQSLQIPDSVTTIGYDAIQECYALASITGGKGVKELKSGALIDSKWYFELPQGPAYFGTILFDYIGRYTGGATLKVKDGTTAIADDALYNKKGFTAVSLPASLEFIGSYAFSYTNLQSVKMPAKLKKIENSAFASCSDLKSVQLNEGLQEIDAWAFENCSALRSITLPNSLKTIGAGAFGGTSIASISVPAGLKSGLEHVVWNSGTLKKITVAAGNPNYSADKSGALFNKDKTELLLYPGASSTTAYAVPNTVTCIAYGAFSEAKNLQSIQLPSNLKTIESNTFSGCTALKQIVIPEGVKSIGYEAFQDCKALTAVTIPNSVVGIENSAFSGCKLLTAVKLPAKLKSLGGCAFENCKKLKSISIPGTVKVLYYNTFDGCKSLKKVSLGEGVAYISESAFNGCKSLAAITLPKSLVYLNCFAFTDCAKLQKIVVKNPKLCISTPSEDDGDPATFPYQVTFYAAAGSTTQSYCKNNGFTFKAV